MLQHGGAQPPVAVLSARGSAQPSDELGHVPEQPQKALFEFGHRGVDHRVDVQVSVAGVPEGRDVDAGILCGGTHARQVFPEMWDRHAPVFNDLQRASVIGQGGEGRTGSVS